MKVCIVGIGIHKFGRTAELTGLQQGAVAARAALSDAGMAWRDIQCAYGGSQDAGNADSMVNELGLTGVQFTNIWNGCATGGSSLHAAYTAIKSGEYDTAMVVGFDKHPRGAFNPKPADWGLGNWYGETGLMLTTQFFAMKTQRYMHEHGISELALSRVAEKAFRAGSLNPNAWRTQPLSIEDIATSTMVSHPLRQYMFCSPAEGGVALILCSEQAAKRYTSKPLQLRAATVRSRYYGSFEVFSPSQAATVTDAPTVTAAKAAFELSGLGPGDMDVLQLQDTDAGTEIIHMAENGFCAHGEQEQLLHDGATNIDGRMPVNTDGGCLANGEPVGASGLRQVYEVCLQLRGDAGQRQVGNNPKAGYTHVYGAPGISGVTVISQ